MNEPVQKFFTNEFDHHFEIDGHPYYMPGITMGDIVVSGTLGEIEDEFEQITAFRDFMIARVRSDRPNWWLWLTGRSVAKAIRSLAPRQLSALYTAWARPGAGFSGEASGSPVSTPVTDAS